ncbi:V4R domain-containing protein [Mesorhizobium sp. UC74_2]|uniref:V4R domain-containing protein n=1 Tax=Mesorhizobium sp. UC74_2 TaxID=3350171 RepID=UPI00366D9455
MAGATPTPFCRPWPTPRLTSAGASGLFARGTGGIELTVRNSPFATGYGSASQPVCHAIAGMVTAVGRMVLDKGVVIAREIECAACGAPACRFEAQQV